MKDVFKIFALPFLICLFALTSQGQGPANQFGKLKLVGLQLSSECGTPVQLRGFSSHGLQWFPGCYNTGSLDAMAYQWKADVFRLALYVVDGGYANDPATWKTYIDNMVDQVGQRGMYCIIDWHILTDGDPFTNLAMAKDFWNYMSKKHGGKKHVIYEICNEPNERYLYGGSANENFVNWNRIKQYADTIIPIIRKNDPNTIIIVGTPYWSNRPWRVLSNTISGVNAKNVMYTFHYYAGTPQHNLNRDTVSSIANKIPLIMTEFGLSTESGDGYVDTLSAQQTANMLGGANAGGQKISWTVWSFSDKAESSAMLTSGSCNNNTWTSRSFAGNKVFQIMNKPGKDTTNCFPIPTIITHPQNITVNSGTSASLSVVASGSKLSYQWQKSSDGINWANVTVGGTASTLTISSATINEKGYYRVTVSNYIASINSNKAYLNIYSNGPFNGIPFPIPGKIEGEAYDIGGQNSSYYDSSPGNTGGAFRTDDVDISAITDSLGGYALGWWTAGEWVDYSVNVLATANYDFLFRIGSANSNTSFKVLLNTTTTIISQVNVPNLNSWSNYQTVTVKGISLTKGTYKMRIQAITDGFNYNYVDIRGPNIDCNGVINGTATVDNCNNCTGGTTGKTACTPDCNGIYGGKAVLDNCGTCIGSNTGRIACTKDCNNVYGGSAYLDVCGTCVGGNTGKSACVKDCNNVLGGSAYWDNCGTCIGGNTGKTACIKDCNNVWGGSAILDNCGTCTGGNTGKIACTKDCNNVWGGTAYLDNCGTCVGGNTGKSACVKDCNNIWGGKAVLDNCGTCTGGNTGKIACTKDCNNVFGGTAYLDNCGTCVGGNTGKSACVKDCNNIWGGKAVLDNCGTCTGGNTGKIACTKDCNNVFGGTAYLDNCGTCVGGNTGKSACVKDCNNIWGGKAVLDNCGTCTGGNTGKIACTKDCNNVWGGTAYLDNCGTCVGGNTGKTACIKDCNNVFGGTAYLDNCGTCVGGNTGKSACVKDCNNIWGGKAVLDNCGTCTGGNTGKIACTKDCNNVFGGTAYLDNCGTCVGGNTGKSACVKDCNNIWGGKAVLDNCGTCTGGNTGKIACTKDCNNVFGGTAYLDNCGTCVGGNTGKTACVKDCNNVFGGTAYLDNCGTCVGGNTGKAACIKDCNNVWGGKAVLDNCGTCTGGNTGKIACTKDCNNVFGGTAYLDNCGTCVGGNTGKTACIKDCNNVWGGKANTDSCGVCSGGNTGILPILQKSLCPITTYTSVDQSSISNVEIYPNPSDGDFILQSTLDGDIEILTLDGITIERFETTSKKTFGKQLNPGVYVLKFKSGTQISYLKIIRY